MSDDTEETGVSDTSTSDTTGAEATEAGETSAILSTEPVATTVADEFPITLSEACIRMSVGNRAVELLHAFIQDEQNNGRFKDTETAYRERFAAFATRPA
ncbi:MAG: hypothetical protein E7K72_25030 [Roseomonas mucosa]|nr:hypothetical protein [Roseomonas mucosa]